MPAEIFDSHRYLDRHELLSYEEIARLARLAVDLGVRKVRVTGGEPLVRRDLPELIALLAAVDGIEDLAMTTNAVLLAPIARDLAAAGLGRVTISLDSLDPEVFARMSGGRGDLAAVLEGLAAATAAGLTPVKVNCVVQRGINDGGVVDLARRFRGTGVVVRFIEYMDVGTQNGWSPDDVVPAEEVLERIGAEFPLEPLSPTHHGEVAERYRYRDGAGEIGVIAAVTRPFCGDCTRARLTSEGRLVTCLFAVGGTDLRAPLRAGASDGELRALLAGVWRARDDRYSELRAELAAAGLPKLEMYTLGG